MNSIHASLGPLLGSVYRCLHGKEGWTTAVTSRERVLTALNHEEPDRVPLFVGASGATSVFGPADPALTAHLGVQGGPER